MSSANRHVDLWLSDFPGDPHEIAATLAVRPWIVSRKGEPYGIRRLPARRNLMVFRHDFTYPATWSEAIEALVSSFGGWEAVGQLIGRLNGTERMVQFTLPISNSPHQENNFIEAPTLVRLAEFGIELGFEFGEYRPGETG